MQSLLAILFPVLLNGCIVTVPGEESVKHHIVLGFGMVSVNAPPEQAAVATQVQALGINISDQPGLKFGLGYSSGTVVTVPARAEDVRLAVTKTPGCPFTVDVQKADLNSDPSPTPSIGGQDE